MKKIIAILLTLFLFSVWFNVKQYSDNNNINNKELTAKEDFEKKVTCRQYLKDVEERYKNEEWGELKIYYSPVKNTCLSTFNIINNEKYKYEIVDILENKSIYLIDEENNNDKDGVIVDYRRFNMGEIELNRLVWKGKWIVLSHCTWWEEE